MWVQFISNSHYDVMAVITGYLKYEVCIELSLYIRFSSE